VNVSTGDVYNNVGLAGVVLFYQGRLKDDLQWVPQTEIELMRRWIADGARP
jgi:hypothetical protein